MSQFSELFKNIKNDSKISQKEEKGKKTTAPKNSKQVKIKDANFETDDNDRVRNLLQEDRNKQSPVPDKAPTTEAQASPLTPEGKSKKLGKSRDSEYTQVLTYIRRDTHRRIKKVLIDDPEGRDFSDLVGELLSNWLVKNS